MERKQLKMFKNECFYYPCLFLSKYEGKMRRVCARTKNEGEEMRKETERKSENTNAGTVRCACCRNETVERVHQDEGREGNEGDGSEARNGEL